MRTALALCGMALALAGCQAVAQETSNQAFVRADGQSIRGNPKLMQQAQLDRTACIGETQRAAVGMAPIHAHGLVGAMSAAVISDKRQAALKDITVGCMAEKGYVLSTQEEAEARRIAAETKVRRR